MKNLLKVLFSLLVGLIVVSPALAYPDVSSNHWAAKQIEILTEKGVIVGYPDGHLNLMIMLHVQNLHQWLLKL